MAHNIYDDYAADYESWFIENDKLFAAEVEAVSALLPPHAKTIDIGCGTGIFTKALGIKTGVEPSAPMYAFAKEKGITVLPGTAERIPAADASWDCAVMITVDCFLPDLAPALQDLHRILNQGGTLLLAFIDRDTPLGQEYERHKKESVYYASATFRSASEIRQLLDDAGFTITDARQTVFSLKNETQPVKTGTGEGVFAVLQAVKR